LRRARPEGRAGATPTSTAKYPPTAQLDLGEDSGSPASPAGNPYTDTEADSAYEAAEAAAAHRADPMKERTQAPFTATGTTYVWQGSPPALEAAMNERDQHYVAPLPVVKDDPRTLKIAAPVDWEQMEEENLPPELIYKTTDETCECMKYTKYTDKQRGESRTAYGLPLCLG